MKKLMCCLMICLGLVTCGQARELPTLSPEAQSLQAGIYQHYKGKLYEVIAVAHHSETLEELVFYRLLYGDYGYWVRPAQMFTEEVAGPDGTMIPRFRYLGKPGQLENP